MKTLVDWRANCKGCDKFFDMEYSWILSFPSEEGGQIPPHETKHRFCSPFCLMNYLMGREENIKIKKLPIGKSGKTEVLFYIKENEQTIK